MTVNLSRESASDRRTTGRAVSVLHVARLVTDTADQLCVVRNASQTGLMIDAAVPPEVGSSVWVEFSTAAKVNGTVRWVVDYRFGIEFTTTTDILSVVDQQQSRLRKQRIRAPRFVRTGSVRVASSSATIERSILNISLNGIRIKAFPDDLAPGGAVRVSIPGLAKCDGRVRWIKSGASGIWFNQPLRFRDLALWLTEPAAATS